MFLIGIIPPLKKSLSKSGVEGGLGGFDDANLGDLPSS